MDYSGSLPDGARIERMKIASGICQHNRLHLAFLYCGRPAEYLLIKRHGEKVRLCERHARELNHRFDESSPENPRVDGSYGWPDTERVNLTYMHPDFRPEPEPEPEKPAFEETAFMGGKSGGGGGGAMFEPAVQSIAERIGQVVNTPDPEPIQAEAPEPLESTQMAQDTTVEEPAVESSMETADTPDAPADTPAET